MILACFLSSSALPNYKKILAYSNLVDTEISSHLPILFCFALDFKSRLVVEAGVSRGESTRAFAAAAEISGFHIIGLDTDHNSGKHYKKLQNATMLYLDDRRFLEYYSASAFRNQPLGFVFIDTSHIFEHTLVEINLFQSILASDGMLMFHDSNVTPLEEDTTYLRINGSYGSALGNSKGVEKAIKLIGILSLM